MAWRRGSRSPGTPRSGSGGSSSGSGSSGSIIRPTRFSDDPMRYPGALMDCFSWRELEEADGKGKVGYRVIVESNHFELSLDNDQANKFKINEAFRKHAPIGYTVVRKSIFHDSFESSDLGYGLKCQRGYFQSCRPLEKGKLLNFDVSHKAFYKPMLVTDFLREFLQVEDFSIPLIGDNFEKARETLKYVRVVTSYRGYAKKLKVFDVYHCSARETMFTTLDGSSISVADFFKTKYNCELNYPDFNVAIMCAPWFFAVPLELCKIDENQNFSGRFPGIEGPMRSAAQQKPLERRKMIEEMLRNRNYGEKEIRGRNFCVEVNEEFTRIEARVLPPPKLGSRTKTILPKMGSWDISRHFVEGFYKPGKVAKWTCVNFSTTDLKQVCQICVNLAKHCIQAGMEFNLEPTCPICDVSSLEDVRCLLAINDLDLLIVILPVDVGELYGELKRICETEFGVISQCFKPKFFKPGRISRDPLLFAALKINAKVGGTNSVLLDAAEQSIPCLTDKETIVFGADVTHDKKGVPSIAAVVASMDWPDIARYRALVSEQGPRTEIIQNLEEMVRQLLNAFKGINKKLPSRIIFYRDGVGETQSGSVLSEELGQIKEACKTLYEEDPPTVTFIIAVKRHHTRLFTRDSAPQYNFANVLPGTVVDTDICAPDELNFYLCSHQGHSGSTSRPTYYRVLLDENKFTADLLQLITYHLCYTFAKLPASVSLVVPVYYAHLAAFRARFYQRRALNLSLPEIQGKVKEKMFFL